MHHLFSVLLLPFYHLILLLTLLLYCIGIWIGQLQSDLVALYYLLLAIDAIQKVRHLRRNRFVFLVKKMDAHSLQSLHGLLLDLRVNWHCRVLLWPNLVSIKVVEDAVLACKLVVFNLMILFPCIIMNYVVVTVDWHSARFIMRIDNARFVRLINLFNGERWWSQSSYVLGISSILVVYYGIWWCFHYCVGILWGIQLLFIFNKVVDHVFGFCFVLVLDFEACLDFIISMWPFIKRCLLV